MARVLTIDDSKAVRMIVMRQLQSLGHEVDEAEDCEKGLAKLEDVQYDLIILYITMPVMDGFAFLHELRLRPGGEHIPVVVLTARDLDGEERRQLTSADRVLSKGRTDLRHLAGELRLLTPAHSLDQTHSSQT